MKILAIESSSLVASIAVLTDDITTAEYTINHKITHSQTLLPMIDDISQRIELDMKEIDAIAISGGPGSFTGLRIGSATAKGLGLALDIPLIHVSTLKAMAYNIFDSESLICPIMDARRAQTYTGVYHHNQGELDVLMDDCAIAIEELIEFLNGQGSKVIFIGDGIPVFRDIIAEKLTVPYAFAPAGMNRQRASSVAILGKIMYDKGIVESADNHLPEYLRVSQAERERAERLAADGK